jgi:hypothetical protein
MTGTDLAAGKHLRSRRPTTVTRGAVRGFAFRSRPACYTPRVVNARALVLAAVLLAAVLLAACATSDVTPAPETRLANAEAEMAACKEHFGLAAVPTPETTMLYDPATWPAMTSEATQQIRVKTMCSGQLEELLNARRDLKRAP